MRTMVDQAHTKGQRTNRQSLNRASINVDEQVRVPYQSSVHRFLKTAGYEGRLCSKVITNKKGEK